MKKQIDRFGFFVHFFFGVLVGAIVGWAIWIRFAPYSNRMGAILVIGLAVLCGLVAGRKGQKFWMSM